MVCQFASQLGTIDVAIDGACRLEVFQLLQHVQRAEIARMPKLVALIKAGK
jgi:hypothetical protein